jgi:hypothetical protein
MNRFEELIAQLAKILNIHLEAEKGMLCKLNIDGKFSVHLQYEESDDLLMMGCMIVEVPPGKFKENVLREALKVNDLLPRLGNMCFSEKGNKLAIYTHISFEGLDAEKFNDMMHNFIDYCYRWYNAVTSGNLAQI